VLAFRLRDERVLLFVGDAQVGNWLSWDNIKASDWKRPDGGAVDYRPTAQELLAKAAVYKVGHHGSHNATLKAKGLERMPDGVIALVPSSRNYPQVQNNWHIPLISLMTALKTKTRGRIVLPHDNPEYTNADFKAQVEVSTEAFDPMQRENKPVIEDGVPVWRQLRL
jgi:hypothetical protein